MKLKIQNLKLKDYSIPKTLPTEIKKAWKLLVKNKTSLVQTKTKEYLFSIDKIIESRNPYVSVSVISLTDSENGDYVIVFNIIK